jgi:MYXO-CTERM domain-containing protein
MKVKTLSALAGLGGTLILSGSADAAYLGVGYQTQVQTVGGVARQVYRLYAVFDNPEDYLTSGAGSQILGPMTIQSRNALDTGAGSNFFNPGGTGANTAPSSPASPNYWGTYVTIGISDVTQALPTPQGSPLDQTSLSPGFPNFIAGNQIVASDAAWFTAGPQEQGRAGHWSQGAFLNFHPDGDGPLAGYGVQLMQLTVNANHNVKGTLAVGVVEAGSIAGGVSIPNQVFSSVVPAPGALALLGLAGLVGARRRRA